MSVSTVRKNQNPTQKKGPTLGLFDAPNFDARGYAETLGAITPSRLKSILEDLDAGMITDAMRLFDEMEEKDLHLGAVTQTRALTVVSKPRAVESASDEKWDQYLARFAADAIARIPRQRSSLTALMSAVTHGFAIAELIWKIEDGAVIVDEIIPRPQYLFTFSDPTDRMRTLNYPDYFDERRFRNIKLPKDKFIYHRPRSDLSALKAGLYRGIAWATLFTNYTIKDWMTFIELHGIPLRLGRYKPGASDESKSVLRRAVKELGSDAAAVISDETTIEFIHAAASGARNLFLESAEFFNRQKSKRILGQTLTTEEGRSGSRALGEVHDRVRADILAYDAAALDETISSELIRPLIDFNFGAQRRYPKMVTSLDDDRRKEIELARIERLVAMGAKIPTKTITKLTGLTLLSAPEAAFNEPDRTTEPREK